MKKIFFVAAIVMMYNSLLAQPVKKIGQLKVTGTQLTSNNGDTVVLRGMSFGWSNLWPRFYTAGAVKTLYKDWNCSVIRASMGIEHVDGSDGYLQLPKWSKQKIKTVVKAAIKQGIYVIIDWHSHNIQQEEAVKFFSEMATEFGKQPNIIYEIFNEPDYETWAEVKKYSEAVIKAIRAIDEDNIILVGCPKWDQDINLPAQDPIKGYSNLMYTVHFYAATHKQYLRDRTDAALQSGLPVFISESAGMEATGNGPLDIAEWQKWIDWMEKRKLSWITWSISDKDETCSVLKTTALSNGKWKDEDLKESGIRIKKILNSYPSVCKMR